MGSLRRDRSRSVGSPVGGGNFGSAGLKEGISQCAYGSVSLCEFLDNT